MLEKNQNKIVASFGMIVGDMVVAPNGPLLSDTQVDAQISEYRIGGCAFNLLSSAKQTGAEVRYIGHVGNDELGSTANREMARLGIELFPINGKQTPRCISVLTPDGNRTLITDIGDARELSQENVDENMVDGIEILHISSHTLFFDLPIRYATFRLIEICKQKKIPITFDAGAANQIDIYGVNNFLNLIEKINPEIFFANEQEATVLGISETGARGAKFTIIHRGSEPTVIISDARSCEIPLQNIPFVDTTGAGDSFYGGVLASLTRGEDIIPSVINGHESARNFLSNLPANSLRQEPALEL